MESIVNSSLNSSAVADIVSSVSSSLRNGGSSFSSSEFNSSRTSFTENNLNEIEHLSSSVINNSSSPGLMNYKINSIEGGEGGSNGIKKEMESDLLFNSKANVVTMKSVAEINTVLTKAVNDLKDEIHSMLHLLKLDAANRISELTKIRAEKDSYTKTASLHNEVNNKFVVDIYSATNSFYKTFKSELKNINVFTSITPDELRASFNADPSWVSFVVPLCNSIFNGTSNYQMIGNRIAVSEIVVNMSSRPETIFNAIPAENATSFIMSNIELKLRMLLVYDRQSNDTVPTYRDVIQDTFWNQSKARYELLTTQLSCGNVSNVKRFFIMADKIINIPSYYYSFNYTTGTGSGSPSTCCTTFSFRYKISDIIQIKKLCGIDLSLPTVYETKRPDVNNEGVYNITTGSWYLILNIEPALLTSQDNAFNITNMPNIILDTRVSYFNY